MQSNELIREVDEELQRDRLLALWRRHGRLLVGLTVVVLVALAGWVGWERYRSSVRAADAIAFAAADTQAREGDPKAAAAAFARLAEGSTTGMATVARLREAGLLERAGDTQAAVAALDRAAMMAADPLLRDLATLQSVALQIDTGNPDTLGARLVPLAAVGAPWRFQARELQATLAIRTGDETRALEILQPLAEDAGAPTNLRQRAQTLRDALQARRKVG